MNKYQQFIFDAYKFDPQIGLLELNYSLDGQLAFQETYRFDFSFTEYDEGALDRAIQLLFFLAGVSYYKAYLPPQIVLNAGQINQQLADFLIKTYQKGLGEFFYVNNLEPDATVNFQPNVASLPPVGGEGLDGLLIAIGGGKDSLVSAELLRNQPKVATWSVGHKQQLEPLVKKIGLPHFWVERTWDHKLLDLKNSEAYNGHIPISAIFAGVGTIVAILTGYKDVVVSNESSASEPNLIYENIPINHQYSKSLEFEKDFQGCLDHIFAGGPRYYSFLRPLSELRISEIFAKIGFEKYKDVFSSCNRAFTHSSDHMFWCGECPKCAFTFLALTTFIPRHKLEELWGGKNLLLDPVLEKTYRQLLGIEGDKPLDCVGEVRESRAAMRLAQKVYPELKKYKFEIPEDYDFRTLSPHTMPAELHETLRSSIS